ncbi:mechanosensitive ion channel family protein [Antarcticibacterium sp. 1MA-6-2]|uniref:mechanosensitive ion channel family protein n=1 Tax=Antarcticibacterium sp. 1MA-6-2 TaxID=2908210 RepID=UPI001F356BAF|nr:mechanosensitive ion channel family protein [Antarcticibacterium sp. 1MA-6-2]UJH91777.1 mechanosensitive ion channel family protein [Antarcticibacterium sp. 1MA-6-2]
MEQDDSFQVTSIDEAFKSFYDSFIEQVPNIGMGILIIILGVLLGTWIGNFAKNRISYRTRDPLMSKFLGKSIRILFIVISIMIGLRAAGLGGIATGILTAAGASAVVLGFAFKDIGENFIAGIKLSFNRPFNINDTVEVGNNFGKVKALEFRYTKLKTFDGKDVYIPNSDVLTEPVTNFTEDGFFRWDFVVGIAYENDIDGAKAIIMKVIEEIPDVIEDEDHQNFVIEEELATSTVNLKVFFWVDTTDFRRGALIQRGMVIRKVKEELEKAGYYLPADIQEIKLYGPEKNFPVRLSKDEKNPKS